MPLLNAWQISGGVVQSSHVSITSDQESNLHDDGCGSSKGVIVTDFQKEKKVCLSWNFQKGNKICLEITSGLTCCVCVGVNVTDWPTIYKSILTM